MIGFLIMVMAGWVIYLTTDYTWLGQIFNMVGAFGAVVCYQMTKERIKRLEDILHKNSTILLRYKNYIAEIKYSDADGIFYGKVNLFKDLIMFESSKIKKIKREFHKTIRDYIRVKKIREKENFNHLNDIDCNNCRFLNLTEQEQTNKREPHICDLYNTRVLHNTLLNKTKLYPCRDCIKDDCINFKQDGAYGVFEEDKN